MATGKELDELVQCENWDDKVVMNHAKAIEEVAEQALERWKHLAEARAQTTLQKLEHAMRTTLNTDVARHRSEFDLAVGIRRSASNTHTVHRPTTFVPSCSNFFSVKSSFLMKFRALGESPHSSLAFPKKSCASSCTSSCHTLQCTNSSFYERAHTTEQS